jgi:hypothetical protein
MDIALTAPSFLAMFWTMTWFHGASRNSGNTPRSWSPPRALLMPLSICIFIAVVLLAAWVGVFGLTPILCPLNGLG